MMEAGRELDALVAEQIFSYTLDYEFADTLGAPCVRELRDQYDEWGVLPYYSTDIAAAWVAADHMCARYDCTIEVKRMASFMPGPRYAALVRGGALDYKRSDITAYGMSDESPAHALCLAMLEAVGARR